METNSVKRTGVHPVLIYLAFVLCCVVAILSSLISYKILSEQQRQASEVTITEVTLKKYTYLVSYSWGQPSDKRNKERDAFGAGSVRSSICGRKFQSEDLDRIQEEELRKLEQDNPGLSIVVVPLTVSLINSATVTTCEHQ